MYYKKYLESLQKLYPSTPNTVVLFLGGSLPATALLHLAQFSLLGMMSRLNNDILHHLGVSILSSPSPPPHSWFTQVDQLCSQYSLPPALTLLTNQSTKASFKTGIKAAVINFWETRFRDQAEELYSLKYFKPNFYSLTTPHHIWSTAGSNPYEAQKAVIQARMLSGRYRTEYLRCHWSQNTDGYCDLSPCNQYSIVGTLEHQLLDCEALAPSRRGVMDLWDRTLAAHPDLLSLVTKYAVGENENLVQFLLDPSTLTDVILARQCFGQDVHIHYTFLHNKNILLFEP